MIPEVVRTQSIEVKENGFTASFSVDNKPHDFFIKYYERDEWVQFPDHLKKYVAELVCSSWVAAVPAQDKIFTFRLSEPDIEVIRFISYQSQSCYASRLDYPAMERRPKHHVTRGQRDWSEFEVDEDGVGLYFSGGRNSFYTLGILEEAGFDTHLQMHNSDNSWEAGQNARTVFEDLERPIDTLWTNFAVVKREITNEHNVFWQDEAPFYWIMYFTSLPYLQYDLNLFGFDASDTGFERVGKDMILDRDWEKSMFSTYYMTRWAQDSGLPLRVGSILRENADSRIDSDLYQRFTDYFRYAVSCPYVDWDSNELAKCSRCLKCQRNYFIRKYSGVSSEVDEDKIAKFRPDADKLIESELLLTDFAHVNANGVYPREPASRNAAVDGLMFKKDRGNPSYFLTESEFKSLYHAMANRLNVFDVSDWKGVGIDELWDLLQEWDIESQYKYNGVVKSNNSLLSGP